MTKRQYLSIENEEQRMVWSGLSSPLQHVLYVQELKGRDTQVSLQRNESNTQQSQTQTETMMNLYTNNAELMEHGGTGCVFVMKD